MCIRDSDSSVTNNGTDNGTIVWNISSGLAGGGSGPNGYFYYQCQNHGSMVSTIQVNSNAAGQVAFTTPGSYNWECPVGVTSVSVVCVGAGGTGGAYGGSGGSLAYKNNITVTPGTTYSIAVGNTNSQIYASPYSFDAENSSAFDCVAFGGIGGYSSGTAEGTFKAIGTGYDGGGRGGLASGDKNVDGVYKEGAGGGARE